MSNENNPSDQGVFHEKYLFLDPLRDDERFKGKIGAVLLSEEIREYVDKYRLLITDPNDFDEEHLKGASYSMKPSPNNEAWQFNEKGVKNHLKKKKEKADNGDDVFYYEVPSKSLVYIRLLETLRLPYYIIGRFNLKVRYTYKGLLLGTGPQVDPGYEARLNIPLHNFTKDPVKIYISDSFVSMDFVRTSILRLENNIPSTRNELLKDEKYEKLRRKLRPQDPEKLKRMEIEDYVGESRPTSSLGQLVKDLEDDRERFENVLSKIKLDGLGIAILVIGLVGLMLGAFLYLNGKIDNILDDFRKEANGISMISGTIKTFNQIEQKIEELNERILGNHEDRILLRNEINSIIKNTRERSSLDSEIKKNQERLIKKIEILERKVEQIPQRSK